MLYLTGQRLFSNNTIPAFDSSLLFTFQLIVDLGLVYISSSFVFTFGGKYSPGFIFFLP